LLTSSYDISEIDHRQSIPSLSQFPPMGLIGSSETSLAGRIAKCEETGICFITCQFYDTSVIYGHRHKGAFLGQIGKIIWLLFGTGARVGERRDSELLLLFPFSLFVVSRSLVSGILVMRSICTRRGPSYADCRDATYGRFSIHLAKLFVVPFHRAGSYLQGRRGIGSEIASSWEKPMKRRTMRAKHEKWLIPIDRTCTRVNERSIPGHDGTIDRIFCTRVPDGVDARNKSSLDFCTRKQNPWIKSTTTQEICKIDKKSKWLYFDF